MNPFLQSLSLKTTHIIKYIKLRYNKQIILVSPNQSETHEKPGNNKDRELQKQGFTEKAM